MLKAKVRAISVDFFSCCLLKIFRVEVCVNTLVVVSIASRKSIRYLFAFVFLLIHRPRPE